MEIFIGMVALIWVVFFISIIRLVFHPGFEKATIQEIALMGILVSLEISLSIVLAALIIGKCYLK